MIVQPYSGGAKRYVKGSNTGCGDALSWGSALIGLCSGRWIGTLNILYSLKFDGSVF